jgi:ubiquinone/menaquinone biosynthesis C-methylase UbiE
LDSEYTQFANEQHRNWNQEHLEIPLLLRMIDIPRGARILEIGTGRGVALLPLAKRLSPSILVGLDIDPRLLADARAQGAAHLTCADARVLPWGDASFDVVIDFGTCYHIARATEALSEIARVLTIGGLYISETRVSQFVSHPVRSYGRRLPWHCVPQLVRHRSALLWQAHKRVESA